VSIVDRLAGHAAALNWHAMRLHSLSRRLWLSGHHATAELVAAANRIITGVEIPPSAEFGPGFLVMHGHGIVVHAQTRAGAHCTLYQQVTIGTRSPDGRPPTLGDHVTLFPGARILGDIHIGDGAQIAANAVVITDVPAGAVVVAETGRVVGSGATA
jgi:serine O-acetyltransferase